MSGQKMGERLFIMISGGNTHHHARGLALGGIQILSVEPQENEHRKPSGSLVSIHEGMTDLYQRKTERGSQIKKRDRSPVTIGQELLRAAERGVYSRFVTNAVTAAKKLYGARMEIHNSLARQPHGLTQTRHFARSRRVRG